MAPPVPDKRAALLQELRTLAKESATGDSARLLTATQVALLFGVSERTIRIWANKDWIPAIRTPSGHWKFPALEVAHAYGMGLQQGQLPFHRREKQVNTDKEASSIDEGG